jgi:redox-sensitive bicupin YhaK (pirin superfamily)
LLRGKVEFSGQSLSAGDGVSLSDEATLSLSSPSGADLMLFDLS